MEIPDGHFGQILLYYFRKGKNAVQARKKLYDLYAEKSLTERQFQKGPGIGTEVDDDKIKAMIENNRRSTTREIAEKLNISQHWKTFKTTWLLLSSIFGFLKN